jgi:hypothetical protein
MAKEFPMVENKIYFLMFFRSLGDEKALSTIFLKNFYNLFVVDDIEQV